jgi:hypothetical protein
MKPEYKKETFEHILKDESCGNVDCRKCYFGVHKNCMKQISGKNYHFNLTIYDHVLKLIDIEEKLEEIICVK